MLGAPCLQPRRQVVLQGVAHKVEQHQVSQTYRPAEHDERQQQRLHRSPTCITPGRACSESPRTRVRVRARAQILLHLRGSQGCFEDSCRADEGL